MLSTPIENSKFDQTVRPQDDLYKYVNGIWLANSEIPSDRSVYGAIDKLNNSSREQVKAILERASSSKGTQSTEIMKIGDLYNSYMNTELLEKLGTKPLDAELAIIKKVSSYNDLIELIVHNMMIGAASPIFFNVTQDIKEPSRYTLYAIQSGLGLFNRIHYYLDEGERFINIRKKYVEFIENMFSFTGQSNPESKAATVMKIETELAEAMWTPVQSRNLDKTYNKYYLYGLNNLTPNFDWNVIYTAMGIDESQDIIVVQPSYLESFNETWKKYTIEEWKIYFTYQLYRNFIDYLTDDITEATFDLFGRTLRGAEKNLPRSTRAVFAVNFMLGDAVGKIYAQEHFSPEDKERIKEIADNVMMAFEKRIINLEWMSSETKKQALDKLDKITTKIGYPDEWKDYSSLEIKADELIGNYIRFTKFRYKRDIARLSGPIDRNEWQKLPQVATAYYGAAMNEIVFSAAFMQSPFFNKKADDAVIYGTIGVSIGHELITGFDNQGRKSDGDGVLREWWTKDDETKFNERAQVLIEQFNRFSVLDSLHVNGELTLAANIRELGALTIAFSAYKTSLNGEQAPIIDGLTGDKRFFIGFTQIWRRKYRDEHMRRGLRLNPYAPEYYRVNGNIQNMPEFYAAFDVKEGDKMFVPVEDRVKIW